MSRMIRYLLASAFVLLAGLAAGCGGDGGSDTAPLAEGRWGHTAIALEDGRILVIGGQSTPSRKLASVEIFDPATEMWSSAASMSHTRSSGHRAVLLQDGRVLALGENDDGAAEIYDPATDQWSAAGALVQARTWASATLLTDGRVLVAGGLDATKAGREELMSAEIFDPATLEWSETTPMEQVHAGHGAVVLEDGKVLVVGRYMGELFDHEAETWAAGGTPTRERSLGATADVLPDGRVLVTGGRFQQGGWSGAIVPVRTAETYNPASNTWAEAASMSEPREDHASVRLNDGRVMVIGDSETEIFDPATGEWTSSGKLKESHGILSTASLLPDGRVIVVGGRIETDEGFRGVNVVEIYDAVEGW
ncbi:MAG: hypothetical protein OYI31_01095 [Chloroflexota bacterium]|nr:hypothetical protein [Chloroflexota bacterium]MDE2941163.1 hypothetical protein [Chloroflexota bacterium]MDE3267042.1 hypothetical protein [Chloroflexota bacterium]